MITVVTLVIIGILAFYIIRKKAMKNSFEAEIVWMVGLLITFFTLLVIATVGFGLEGLMSEYSVGERNGYITKISEKGVVFRTHEGELQLGVGQQASLQEPFTFSVSDHKVLKQIQDAAGKNQRIKLHYRQWLVMPWRVGDSGYEITKVEFLPSEKN